MDLLLLLTLFCLSLANVQPKELPTKDQVLLGELKALGENLLRTTLDSELRNRLTVAQLIIDSHVAPQSIIEGMQAFISHWNPVLPRVSVEDYDKFSVEFPKAFGREDQTKYKEENGSLNHYTKGAFSAMKAQIQRDDRERLSAFKDISVLKMAEVSQETKAAGASLLNSYNNFVNANHLKVRNFKAFLRELRKY